MLFVYHARFEVLTSVLMKNQLFRDSTPCRTVNSNYLPDDTASYPVVTQLIFPSKKHAKKLCTLIKSNRINYLTGIKCIKVHFDTKDLHEQLA